MLYSAQNFGKRTQSNITDWKLRMLTDLTTLSSERTDERPLLIKLSSYLEQQAASFFSTTAAALPSNLTVAGITKAVHKVPVRQPVMALMLMCPNKDQCCADRYYIVIQCATAYACCYIRH
jgi:hypothetical protein